MELSWAVLGRLGALLGRLDAVLGASLAVLGHLGPSLCQLGSLGSRPGGHLGRLEAEKSAGEAKSGGRSLDHARKPGGGGSLETMKKTTKPPNKHSNTPSRAGTVADITGLGPKVSGPGP